MSYDGRLGFGLLGDYDALPDLDERRRRPRALDRRARARRPGVAGEDRLASAAGRRARAQGRRDVVRRLLALAARHRAGGRRRLRAAAGVQRARRRGRRRPRRPRGPASCSPTAARATSTPAQHVPLEGLTDPPTSGAHHERLPTREGRLSPDEILHALELGDVILFYDATRPPAALRALQRDVSGPFDAEVAAAGQQVILARRAGRGRGDRGGVAAAAARRRSRRPALREFAEAWIGRGAG